MFGQTFANDLLKLIFTGVNIANIADNAATSPITSLVLALHTADPGATGNQSSNELGYTGYARVAVPRLPANWTITNNVISPAGRIEFGKMTAGTEQLATHVSIGIATTGATKILCRAALSPSIQCRLGVIPAIETSATLTLLTS